MTEINITQEQCDAGPNERTARMRKALHQVWDLEDELGIEREGYADAQALTDHQRLTLVKTAWESDPRRCSFDDAHGPELANVMRDVHAVLRKLGLHE